MHESAIVTRMTSKKQSRGPSVIALLLSAAFLIGVIFFVSNPEEFKRTVYPLIWGKNYGSAAASSIVKEVTIPAPAKRKAKPVASAAPTVEVTPPKAEAAPVAETVAVPPATEEPITKPDPSRARVRNASTMAYTSTSSRSFVVSVLEKDANVDVTFELVNSEGRWSMIRIEGLDQPVFVRSENLERPAKK